MRRADLLAGAGLFVLGIIVLFVVIPAEADGDTWSGVSPLFFPTLIVVGFIFASAGLFARALLDPASYKGMPAPLKLGNFGFFCIACLVILGAVLAIHFFGFVYGGPLLVAALMLFMGERKWKRILPTAVIPVLVIYFFVYKVLNAPLPAGWS